MNWLDKREYDIMHEKGLDDKVAVEKIACLEINDIDEIGAFVNEMYNKRYANAVQIDARGAKFTYQELINSKMIEVKEGRRRQCSFTDQLFKAVIPNR